jgi:hypothetical protein
LKPFRPFKRRRSKACFNQEAAEARVDLEVTAAGASRVSGRTRSAELKDIALAVFAVVVISALLIAFVSLH